MFRNTSINSYSWWTNILLIYFRNDDDAAAQKEINKKCARVVYNQPEWVTEHSFTYNSGAMYIISASRIDWFGTIFAYAGGDGIYELKTIKGTAPTNNRNGIYITFICSPTPSNMFILKISNS